MVDEIKQNMVHGRVYTVQQVAYISLKPMRDIEPELSRLCTCGQVRRIDNYTKDGKAGYQLTQPHDAPETAS